MASGLIAGEPVFLGVESDVMGGLFGKRRRRRGKARYG
jgi:hypothetical protein